ncbi:hypothetical protein QBC44DRAFT_366135 [Cladorrhinum sp. PSN332]|nr:hypothetical protein QBC44DRAFT_366135 [Cladorrhinum sp. PSN332]
MVAIANLVITVAATFGLVASAEYLAVIETNPTFLSGGASIGAATCYPQKSTYTVVDFGNSHAPGVGSTCTTKGKQLAFNGDKLEGCPGKWSNGYKVCVTSYGGNVHNGKGYHQRCNKDDTTIFNCPSGAPCWTNRIRKLKCQGVWHKDA